MWRRLTAVTVAAVALAACTPDGNGASSDDDATGPDSLVVPQVTVPPERLSPFCQAMLALDEEVREAPDAALSGLIIDAYRAALPDVPPAIAVEFEAVLDALERDTTATLPPIATSVPASAAPTTLAIDPDDTIPVTVDTFFEEGYLPDDTPAARVNEYIDFACRGNQNNPGPPATQPGGAPTIAEG